MDTTVAEVFENFFPNAPKRKTANVVLFVATSNCFRKELRLRINKLEVINTTIVDFEDAATPESTKAFDVLLRSLVNEAEYCTTAVRNDLQLSNIFNFIATNIKNRETHCIVVSEKDFNYFMEAYCRYNKETKELPAIHQLACSIITPGYSSLVCTEKGRTAPKRR